MLTCVYHPIDKMRVLESEDAQNLISTGVWFDCPKKASEYRAKVELDIKNEKSVKINEKSKGKSK